MAPIRNGLSVLLRGGGVGFLSYRHGSAAVEEDRAWGAAVDVGADRDVTEAIVRAGAPFLRVLDGHGRSGGRSGDSE